MCVQVLFLMSESPQIFEIHFHLPCPSDKNLGSVCTRSGSIWFQETAGPRTRTGHVLQQCACRMQSGWPMLKAAQAEPGSGKGSPEEGGTPRDGAELESGWGSSVQTKFTTCYRGHGAQAQVPLPPANHPWLAPPATSDARKAA